MSQPPHTPAQEAVGAAYRLDLLQLAQQRSWAAIDAIAAAIHPGMDEQSATRMALQVLQAQGMQRTWHPVLIRFGANTLNTFKQPSRTNPVLGDDDIFFIDIGPVFDGHEGDAGATFTTGRDAGMAACAAAARTLHAEVADFWHRGQVTGPELYAYAGERAVAMGWRLNPDIQGHRVSDFPHALYQGGCLGAGNPARPSAPALWCLLRGYPVLVAMPPLARIIAHVHA
jgi:Xaa-Pro aminopeptidase